MYWYNILLKMKIISSGLFVCMLKDGKRVWSDNNRHTLIFFNIPNGIVGPFDGFRYYLMDFQAQGKSSECFFIISLHGANPIKLENPCISNLSWIVLISGVHPREKLELKFWFDVCCGQASPAMGRSLKYICT